MSQLRRNVIANFVGKGCAVAANLAFVPLYLKTMGLDASGLVGFNVTLNAAIQLLDMGLSTTLNREMAQLSAEAGRTGEARSLVRTLEMVYWPISLLIAVGIAAVAGTVAHHWFRSQHLPPVVIQRAVVMMGVSIALQWPYSLYEGGLLGLQKQVLVNAISTVAILLRTLGALLVLNAFGRTIDIYFGWQILISAAMTAAVWVGLWRNLPSTGAQPRFDRAKLTNIRGFATGVMGSAVAAFAVSQCDRIVLSRQVRLEIFGCYTVAAQMAGVLLYAATPFFTALFPRFVQMHAAPDQSELRQLYHRSSQLVSVVILPIAVMLAVYARDLTGVLEAWTGKPLHLANTDRVLALLAIGFGANAVMNLPYALQVASGWTKLALFQNAATLCVQIPLTLWLVARWGPVGASFVWVLVNAAYFVIMIPIMHTRLLKGELAAWYLRDVGVPAAVAIAVAGCARLLPVHTETVGATVIRISLIGIATAAACVVSVPATRDVLRARLRRPAIQGVE